MISSNFEILRSFRIFDEKNLNAYTFYYCVHARMFDMHVLYHRLTTCTCTKLGHQDVGILKNEWHPIFFKSSSRKLVHIWKYKKHIQSKLIFQAFTQISSTLIITVSTLIITVMVVNIESGNNIKPRTQGHLQVLNNGHTGERRVRNQLTEKLITRYRTTSLPLRWI